jgi:hypothetical protein
MDSVLGGGHAHALNLLVPDGRAGRDVAGVVGGKVVDVLEFSMSVTSGVTAHQEHLRAECQVRTRCRRQGRQPWGQGFQIRR